MRTILTRARPLALSALVLAAGSVAPAEAAKPPEGRTYYTVAVGLGGGYESRTECFEFRSRRLCSLDGRFCGDWQRDDRRTRETGFSFSLSALDDDGLAVTLEGRGRIETRGRLSSIAGVGLFAGEARRGNFSFAGREVDAVRCLELLETTDDGDDDDRTVVVGSGRLATESRDVSGFTGVVLNGVGEVSIRHTGSDSLTVTADDNLLPLLRSEVRGGRLLLSADPDRPFRTENKIRYEITIGRLQSITISGVGSVEASGVDVDSLEVDIRGVSVVTPRGRVDRQMVRVAGVSAYQARGLRAREAKVDVDGVSHAVVRVSELLEGRLTGASILEYVGNPRLDVTVAPGCTLRRAD